MKSKRKYNNYGKRSSAGKKRAGRRVMTEPFEMESLKKIELFASLSPEELRQVRERIVIRKFKKNEVILHEENTSEYMYVILEGEAKVIQVTGEGKGIIVTMHQSGDFFGELSLIDGKTAPATVKATRDTTTAIIAKEDFYALLYNQKKILENLLHILSSRLRESWKRIQLLNFNDAAQRIKMLFLMLSETYGKETPRGMLLSIKLIHQDIADMTGLTRETVTRVLDRLQKAGEIKILENKFIQLNPEFESISL
jgi:CRP/FNR family cyclic AMP-dependent transcriptional regulator